MTNSDLGRLLRSDEIQNAVRKPQKKIVRHAQKKNPLKNLGVMIRLNPYAEVTHRTAIVTSQANGYKRQCEIAKRRGVSILLSIMCSLCDAC